MEQGGDGAWKGEPERERGLGGGTVEIEPVGKGAGLRQGSGGASEEWPGLGSQL